MGAHIFVVLPGLTRPPEGFDSFLIVYDLTEEQPFWPKAVIVIVNAPKVEYWWETGKLDTICGVPPFCQTIL